MKVWMTMAAALLLAACSGNPARPLAGQEGGLAPMERLYAPVEARIHPGDVLEVRRDYQSEAERFRVREDGRINYPLVGPVTAAGKSPEALGEELTERLRPFYQTPGVTVNVVESPGNRVFVGGIVGEPGTLSLEGGLTLRQALLAAGDIPTGGDRRGVVLLRKTDDGRYDVFLFDFDTIYRIESERGRPIPLRRDDIVLVPKTRLVKVVEGVDLYIRRLLPFSLSTGFYYDLRNL